MESVRMNYAAFNILISALCGIGAFGMYRERMGERYSHWYVLSDVLHNHPSASGVICIFWVICQRSNFTRNGSHRSYVAIYWHFGKKVTKILTTQSEV